MKFLDLPPYVFAHMPRRSRRETEAAGPVSELDRISAAVMASKLARECARITVLHRAPASYGMDLDSGWWVMVENWTVPKGMDREATPLIMMVPPDYPKSAPVSLLVPVDLGCASGVWTVSELLPVANNFDISSAVPAGWARCAVPVANWGDHDDLDRLLDATAMILTVAVELTSLLDGAGRQFLQGEETTL